VLATVAVVAFVAAALTLFSGFGVGTLLLPAFLLFFPPAVAVAMTALVHLANNLFKAALLGRHTHWPVVWRFGLPAIVTAVLGALALAALEDMGPLYTYRLQGRTLAVTPLDLVIALLMAAFAVAELSPRLGRLEIDRRWLPLGGMLSGLFGGLSGHQGAFRSAFLVRAGLGKEGFVATGVIIACIVDVGRLLVYWQTFAGAFVAQHTAPLVAGCAAAFAGSFLATRLLEQVTYRVIRYAVAGLMLLVAAGLAAGLI
jgi:hypothetical protein